MMPGKEWNGMELNDLVIFKTVIPEGSISKAAKELGYLQPNVTERMKKVKQELETKLFLEKVKGYPADEILTRKIGRNRQFNK